MAKIKKIIEDNVIHYPATITDAVKNPNNGKTVTEELSELGSEVGASLYSIKGKYINQSGSIGETTNSNAITEYLPLKNIEKIVIRGRSRTSVSLYAFYDKDKKFISGLYGEEYSRKDVTIDKADIPSNATYIIANGFGDGTDKLLGYNVAWNYRNIKDLDSEVESLKVKRAFKFSTDEGLNALIKEIFVNEVPSNYEPSQVIIFIAKESSRGGYYNQIRLGRAEYDWVEVLYEKYETEDAALNAAKGYNIVSYNGNYAKVEFSSLEKGVHSFNNVEYYDVANIQNSPSIEAFINKSIIKGIEESVSFNTENVGKALNDIALLELDVNAAIKGEDTVYDNTSEFEPTTTAYSSGRIIADTSFTFKDGDILSSVGIVSNGTARDTEITVGIYNSANKLVESFSVGTIEAATKMVDVTDRNIVLHEGYKVAFSGELTYRNKESIDRFYDFASLSYINNYFYGIKLSVKSLSLKGLSERLDKLESEGTSEVVNVSPKFINPTVDVVSRPTLKILEIGNSYTTNPTRYLLDIVNGAIERGDIKDLNDIAYCQMWRSSASFKTWYDTYNDADIRNYWFTVRAGNASLITTEGATGEIGDGSLMKNVLTQQKWDIIIIHQASGHSNNPSVWEGDTSGGYLVDFLKILKRHQPQAEIGFTLVHSYAANYSGNTEGSTLARWENICKGVQFMQNHYGVRFIVPYGTAIQNLRKVYNVTGELTEDLTHPAYGLCSYASSLCFFDLLFGRRFGVSIMDDNWAYDGTSDRASSDYPDSIIDVNDETRHIAKEAALNALVDMYEIK